MIENLLIIDTETTGLDPRKGSQLIEIAAVLFNVKHKTVLQSFATLLPCDENPVEGINKISAESTRCDYAFKHKTNTEIILDVIDNPNIAPVDVHSIIVAMNNKAQACVAHNAEFDMKFIESQSWGSLLLENKWICTKKNFTWPVPLNRFRQQDICNAMGVPYVDAHRALSDCMMLVQCFQKVEDLQERINRC